MPLGTPRHCLISSLANTLPLSSYFLNSLFEVAVHERMQTRIGECALSAPRCGICVDLVTLPFARLRMKLKRLLLAVTAIVSTAAPAMTGDEHDCFQGREPELRIKACSDLIQRGPDDAIAYHNRAVAYGLAGDIDNAIADYTKVIQIAPDNASAYDNRGRAYASKGDYTHAVEDGTKAHELMAKATAQPITVTPKAPKAAKITANAQKAAKPAPKADSNATKAAPGSSWWSWLNPGTNSADQAGSKNTKP
jgi:tetratricopeptide (TPR) repeat protein